MTIEQFATEHRVKIVRDDCNDQIIQGNRGHLYFDGPVLCLMALDAKAAGMNDKQIRALGGKCWTGTRWLDDKRCTRRDVKVENIPLENGAAALKLIRCRKRPTAEVAAENAARIKDFRFPSAIPPSGDAKINPAAPEGLPVAPPKKQLPKRPSIGAKGGLLWD